MKNLVSDEKKWGELHLNLQDLLAGYVDDELNVQEKLIIEAHLAGCESCRTDVARQQLMNQRLSTFQLERLLPAMQQKIDVTLGENLNASSKVKQSPLSIIKFFHCLQHKSSLKFIAATGWSVACILIIVLLTPTFMLNNKPNVPMVDDVLAGYLHLDKTTLPKSNHNLTIAAPANWPNARLLTSWETTVGGAPATAFAMRNGDNIIIQYRIDENVFFRNPSVRLAVAKTGSYLSQTNNLQVLAMPLKDSGLLVVGPIDSMPSPKLITFAKT